MKYLFFVSLLFCAIPSAASGPLVIGRDLPGWKIDNPDFYNAKQLYGYINGGAELYLEYGFKQVSAQRCTNGEFELQVDIYEMVSPEAAFGIFSILRGKCATPLKGALFSCSRSEQILFARDRYLVSVVPYDRSNTTRDAATAAATALLLRIGKKEHRPNELFRSGPLSPGFDGLRYFHGPLALQSALDDWSDRLAGIDRFDLEHSRFGKGSQQTEAAVIRFRSRRDCEKFLSQSRLSEAKGKKGWYVDNGTGRSVMIKGGKTVYYLAGGQAKKLRPRIK